MSTADVQQSQESHRNVAVQVTPTTASSTASATGCSFCDRLHKEIRYTVNDFGLRLDLFLQRLEMLVISQQPNRPPASPDDQQTSDITGKCLANGPQCEP
ncbi:unnamed protein product [Soboliphyme baturini]|uniref:Uncharacterized protein n=1 Tax=Soboliphyme baturini TaxID=241478 RepID=A0A183JA06_9BILA|nr:unnamed protein product [Soboliphyme baturini]